MMDTSKLATLPQKCINAVSREFDAAGLTLEYTDPMLKDLIKRTIEHIIYDIREK